MPIIWNYSLLPGKDLDIPGIHTLVTVQIRMDVIVFVMQFSGPGQRKDYWIPGRDVEWFEWLGAHNLAIGIFDAGNRKLLFLLSDRMEKKIISDPFLW